MKHPAFVCCAVSFLFLGATSVQAQETSDLTDVHFYPPSAVSMMKYIDYPVSHRTGIPEISIPLYTVRSGSLELPVNLSFHLDDFTRVNQLAGVTTLSQLKGFIFCFTVLSKFKEFYYIIGLYCTTLKGVHFATIKAFVFS